MNTKPSDSGEKLFSLLLVRRLHPFLSDKYSPAGGSHSYFDLVFSIILILK